MKRHSHRTCATRGLACAAALGWLAACGGPPSGNSPGSGGDLATPLVVAMREEAKGDPARATALYLDALDAAVRSPGNPWQLVVEQAALDALVWRSVPALSDVSEDAALVYRTRDASLATPAAKGTIASRLASIAGHADDAFSAGLLARAMEELAEHRGDAADAERWRTARGCAREATIVGPLTWTALTGVGEEDPLAAADARLGGEYHGPGAFAPKLEPVRVSGHGCALDLAAVSTSGGVRDVVIDVDVKRAGRIGVSLRAHGPATLRAGGAVVITRAYELGGGEAARFARVDVQPGTLRLVARVGVTDDDDVEVDAWDAHGAPLAMHAPKVGEAGTVRATGEMLPYPTAKSDVDRAALAVGALAAGDGRVAEQATSLAAKRDAAPPELLLAYARAVDTARDLDPVHRAERARGAYERVLEAWPTAWEAIVAHAVLAGVRRGQSEARIESLKDLDQHRGKADPAALPILDAFDAATSGRDQLFDRARAALDRARAALPGTALVRDASRAVFPRTGAERVAVECATDADVDRGRLDCYDARRAAGDRVGAAKELDRLRATLGGPSLFLAVTLREALAVGDMDAAARAFDAMTPGERTLSGAYGTVPVATRELSPDDARKQRERLLAMARFSRDAPSAMPPLFRALGDDPTAPYAGIAEKITAADRASTILPSAATAVLAHAETYDVDASGLVRFVLFDVRRVSGTTDVEENAQASPPDVAGRTTMRILRRRIFKKDGRVLEPERTPGASQGHAELSQLEQGDAIEAIYEGWSLPGDTGDVRIDTPDLLPERTAVHDATLEMRMPVGLRGSQWTHPLLGKPQETVEGNQRVLRWHARDKPVRRIEDGIPKMDRDVSVSFSTQSWSETARALREALAALDESDPELGSWAREAAKGKTEPRAIVDAIVEAAGAAVKESSASTLSDLEIGRPTGPQSQTARSILANQEGSRTWLVVRALRELGIKTDVVVAENEPFSADPAFPPHDGRFTHPLAVAHLPGAPGVPASSAPAGDVWIDADVPGPPLPPGHVSPELRGRSALHADGAIAVLPNLSGAEGSERDEVDIRLALDAKGDAKGTLTVLLRGREAQELAEALVRIVGDERQRALRGVALAWVPFANVDQVALSSSEGSWQVSLRADLTIPAYAQPEGSKAGGASSWVLPGIDPMHYVYPRPYVTTLSATFASRGSRQDALAINRALQYHVHRRIELPAGATVTRAPGAFRVGGAVLAASRAIRVSPSIVEEDFGLEVATGTVPTTAYGAFVTAAHDTDDAFLASTRVKPAP